MAEEKSPCKFDDPKAAFAEAEKRIEKASRKESETLNLFNLGLAEIPESISSLRNLRMLQLSHNRLTQLPDSISSFEKLSSLSISGNQLTFLPAFLSQLGELREVFAANNDFEELPEFFTELTNLEVLVLSGNKLRTLPTSWGKLSRLWRLSLDLNQLTEIPPSFGDMRRLRSLDLRNNNLTALPETLQNLRALDDLQLDGNEALGLPSELLGGLPENILDYYFRVRFAKRPLNEAKLILLGRGEVGKTCLANRLVHNRFKSTKMTKGIAITQWPVTVGKDSVRLHVWDFGGQEIQHATHKFFLTKRSLYLVVLNGRAGDEENDAEYWLKFVKTFGASSPTIVVLNKFQMQPFQVNRRKLQEKYPFIRAFVQTDCKPNIKNGRVELIKEIESAIGGMEHVRAAFPTDWFRIKERLAEMEKPFISFDEYRKICVDLGEKDTTAQERLAGFLDDLGIALNFREDPQLREETVLNPRWITEGVYQIITSKLLAERKGELRLTELARILPGKTYPARMHQFLIELMRKFELCFSFHDDPIAHRYLVPELLGNEKPALKEPFPPQECLSFRYDYHLMPEGLLPRFITRTHTMSEPGERWRTGVVLRWEACRALVEADKQEFQVLVRVLGEPEKRRRLLAAIRENFDQIHMEMTDLRPVEWVSVEGRADQWVDYQDLATFQKNRVLEIVKRSKKIVKEL